MQEGGPGPESLQWSGKIPFSSAHLQCKPREMGKEELKVMGRKFALNQTVFG